MQFFGSGIPNPAGASVGSNKQKINNTHGNRERRQNNDFVWWTVQGTSRMYLGCLFVFTRLQLTPGSWGMTNTNSERGKQKSPISYAVSVATDWAAPCSLYYYFCVTRQICLCLEAFAVLLESSNLNVSCWGIPNSAGFVLEIYRNPLKWLVSEWKILGQK